MPTFEEMKTKYKSMTIGQQIRESSKMVMNDTFSNTNSYRVGKIYDCNNKEILDSFGKPIELEFKFLKIATYTSNKDQVEYMVMFRPGVNPEIDYDYSSDRMHRLGFYIDILDENTNEVDKWLILGKDISEFDKYLVLKCNWTFEWIDKDRIYHSCLGCVRDRNNYNSGIWSDGITTTIQNQTAFYVPTNDDTRSIDYGIRFMITDNHIHPKTYEITKLMDNFPLGCTKVTLAQCHYNAHTDLCESTDLQDGKGEIMHRICDYYLSSVTPITHEQNDKQNSASWVLEKINDKIYVGGQPIAITANPNQEISNGELCQWHIYVDNVDYTDRLVELDDYLNITFVDNRHIIMSAINKDLADYVIKFAIFDEDRTYYDFVETEVTI